MASVSSVNPEFTLHAEALALVSEHYLELSATWEVVKDATKDLVIRA